MLFRIWTDMWRIRRKEEIYTMEIFSRQWRQWRYFADNGVWKIWKRNICFGTEEKKIGCQQQKYINLNADTLTETWCNKLHWRMKPPYMWNVVHNMWNTSINWITTWIVKEIVEEWFTLNTWKIKVLQETNQATFKIII